MGSNQRFQSARHWVELSALLGVREVFRHLSPERAVALGAGIGRAWARAGALRTDDAAVNLRIAFPDWTEAERTDVLVSAFANLGRHLAEVCLLQGRQRAPLLAGVDVEGHEHYEDARRRSESGAVIALTAHFGSWEISAAAMADRGYPLSVVGHPLPNQGVQRMVSQWRTGSGASEISLGHAATGVFRAMARGDAIAMLLDQNAHAEEGVFAPFFGRPALTRSGPMLLAMRREVPLLPVFIHRVGTSARHVVRFSAALEIEPAGDDQNAALERNARRVNECIESAIRERPDHWMWPHRRFKTQPEGIDSPYSRRRRMRRKSV